MPHRKGSPDRQPAKGFTLIEQIVVLAILAVLTAVAAPSLRQMAVRHRVRTRQADYIAALNHARSVAISQNTATLLCPTRDGEHCADASNWSQGWLLAADEDGDEQPDAEPFFTEMTDPEAVAVRSSAGRDHALFRPDGTALGTNLTLVICAPGRPDLGLSVILANSGRVRGAEASAEQLRTCLPQG